MRIEIAIIDAIQKASSEHAEAAMKYSGDGDPSFSYGQAVGKFKGLISALEIAKKVIADTRQSLGDME